MSNKPLKIMYLMDFFVGKGGTEGQLLHLISNLDRKIVHPSFAVFRQTDYLKRNPFPCQITVLDIGRLLSIDTVFKLKKLTNIIRNSDIDMVHIFFNDASIAAPFFCKVGGAKVIVSRRDMGFWYTPMQLAALRISNLFVDRMVANSIAVKKNASKCEGISEDAIDVIYNGHDSYRFETPLSPDFRKVHGIGAKDPIVGMVARLAPIKRQSDLIKAFALVLEKHPNAHLVFLGEGETSSIEGLARSLKIEERIHLTGNLIDVIPIIKHFTIGVLCSDSEGLSNAVIEYMGCGIPTICTDVGGNPELIKDGVNGFLIELGNINALADRITMILSDPSLARRLGEKAKETILDNFSTEIMINSHIRLYQHLVDGDRLKKRGRQV